MKLGKGISAIIAGGATGVGAATAEALAVKGCKVANSGHASRPR